MEEQWRLSRMHEVMRALGPSQWHTHPESISDEQYFQRAFTDLSPGEQSMVLLMRALVNRPALLILDEVFAGMDGRMVEVAKTYLREGLEEKQAVVFVTHWEEELPWGREVRRIRLVGGGKAEMLVEDM